MMTIILWAGTYSLLAELLGTLVLGVLDQFHDTTLIRGKASNLTDEITNELGALALDLQRKTMEGKFDVWFKVVFVPGYFVVNLPNSAWSSAQCWMWVCFPALNCCLLRKFAAMLELSMCAAFFDHSIWKWRMLQVFAQCCKLTLMDGCACLMYDRVLMPLQFVSIIVNLSIHPSIHQPITSKKVSREIRTPFL